MAEAAEPNVTKPLPKIGSYRLIQQLGSGGMSSVFRAIHTETGHEVAVKVLPRYLAKNPTLLQRFLREAKNAEALEHPNIVSIFDRGSEEGRYYLVLEYIPGGDLHDRVREKGPLGAAEAVRILREVANGLRFAAGRGVIHRDIKPANLLLSPEGVAKITDLGLALQVTEEDERVTRDGTTVGTVDYMAPEQARDSRATSVRSDIYSLGCTCYYLTTGGPPFPGGDVAEKLRRHAQEPPPDVRDVRPGLPESLSRLIRKMMAKRPEDRFGDYDHLIRAIDRLKLDGQAAGPAPLTALIDDEDEDGDHPESFTLAGPIPMAEIDDEDDDGPAPPSTIITPTAAKGRPPSGGGAAPPRRKEPRPPSRGASSGDVNLSELAALDEDEAPVPTRRRRTPASVPVAPPPAAILDDEEPEAAVAGPARAGGGDAALRTYIVRGLMFGLVAVLVGFGLFQLADLATSTPPEAAKSEEGSLASAPEAGPPSDEAFAPPKASELPKTAVAPPRPPGETAKEAPTAATTWDEPAEVPRPEVPEKVYDYPPEWQLRFVPEWATIPAPDETPGPFVRVRRVSDERDVVSNLTLAFNQSGGTVEVADDGPFFERDVRITGAERLIRARPGFRPIWVVGAPASEFFKERPGVFDLEDKRVVYRGIDFVLRSDDFARQSALFTCRGGELTLVDCTVTIVGSRPMAVVQVGEPGGSGGGKPTRVRLERTFLRGSALTAFRLTGDPAEVVVDRSVLLCGGGPAVTVAGRASGPRKLWWKRSVAAARGPILDLASAGAGSTSFHALGTTLARIQGPSPTALIELRDDAAGSSPRDAVDWLGFDNVVAGFDGWLAANPGHKIKVPDLAAAQGQWPGTDDRTRSDPNPWPESDGLDEATPEGLARIAPEGAPTLARVAIPTPYLWPKTLGSFSRQKVVNTPRSAGPAGGAPGFSGSPGQVGGLNIKTDRVGSMPVGSMPGRPAPTQGPQATTGELDLTFDAQAEPWKGDLGAFLKDQIKEGVSKVRVRARGGWSVVSSPIRPPDGVSLEIVVEPSPSAGPLTWWPDPDASGDAFVEVRGGDLSINGAWLARLERRGLRHMVLVEDGRLTLSDCRITTSMAAEPDAAGLVAFRTVGTRPLPERPGAADRPVARIEHCVLLAGGTAVEASLGSGVVALEDCALASGSDAIALLPQRVRRDRFLADLWLDRCTLVAARSFVRLGHWPGAEPGPDRPWVVFSQKSAFLDAFERARPARQAALLRADAEAMAHGAVFWQPGGDAYDVARFVAVGDGPTAAPAKGPDVDRDWVALWGRSHVRSSVLGPSGGKSNVPVQIVARRLKPGAELKPGDLALDPPYPKGRKSLDIGADSRRLRIAPAGRDRAKGGR